MDPIQSETHERPREGKRTSQIEQLTARAPSSTWLWMAGGAIVASIGLFMAGRKQDAIFVGLWPAAMLVMGNYNKMVKVMGSGGERAEEPLIEPAIH